MKVECPHCHEKMKKLRMVGHLWLKHGYSMEKAKTKAEGLLAA